MPPMAIVEEVILGKPIIVPSYSLLYTFLDPHDPPRTSHSVPVVECGSEWVTCIIQEEILLVDSPIEPPPPSSSPE